MKVRMLAIAAGPEGSLDVGDLPDPPAEQALEWIALGYAVAVNIDTEPGPDHPDPHRSVTPETTSAKHPHAEHAVKVEKGHRGA
jgi:hypothetical protein